MGSRFAEVMARRQQARVEQHNVEALAKARQYQEWSRNECWKHLVESIEQELEDLNRKEASNGDEAIQLQGERRALQRRLDALRADRREADRIVAAQLNQ